MRDEYKPCSLDDVLRLLRKWKSEPSKLWISCRGPYTKFDSDCVITELDEDSGSVAISLLWPEMLKAVIVLPFQDALPLYFATTAEAPITNRNHKPNQFGCWLQLLFSAIKYDYLIGEYKKHSIKENE